MPEGLTLEQVVAIPRREARCMACGSVHVPGPALPWFRTGELRWGWLCRGCLGEASNHSATVAEAVREPEKLPPRRRKRKEPEPVASVPESDDGQIALFEAVSPDKEKD
jgi:hypothetical protein